MAGIPTTVSAMSLNRMGQLKLWHMGFKLYGIQSENLWAIDDVPSPDDTYVVVEHVCGMKLPEQFRKPMPTARVVSYDGPPPF